MRMMLKFWSTVAWYAYLFSFSYLNCCCEATGWLMYLLLFFGLFFTASWLMHLLLGWAWSLVVHLLHVICALSLHLWNINLTHVLHALVLVKNQGYTCIVSNTFLFKEILLKWHCLLIYGWWTSQYNNRYFYCHRLPSLPRKDSKSVFFCEKIFDHYVIQGGLICQLK